MARYEAIFSRDGVHDICTLSFDRERLTRREFKDIILNTAFMCACEGIENKDLAVIVLRDEALVLKMYCKTRTTHYVDERIDTSVYLTNKPFADGQLYRVMNVAE